MEKFYQLDQLAGQSRQYFIAFNTILGELFLNNLITYNFDMFPYNLYKLPYTAQMLYRRLLIHNSLPTMELNLSTIREALNLTDDNITNVTDTIEQNGFEPLQKHGFIISYERDQGLDGLKYIVRKPSKTRGKKISE